MEKMDVNKKEQSKSNINYIDKSNYHQMLSEFKSLISKSSNKLIILNIVDSLNINYSKLFDKLTSNIKDPLTDNLFFSNVFFPTAIEYKNSQILYFEITILYENEEEKSKRNSETFIIPSIKFHKFISESFLNLNPSLLNFLSNNKSLFAIKNLLDINTLSYMPSSVDLYVHKNFEKIKKFGKPTKNEYKKSYYFFPKSLTDPVNNTKKRLENFFKNLNSKIIELKNDEKNYLEQLQIKNNNFLSNIDKVYFKDNFSVEKVMEFKYMFLFKKYDENFIKINFTKFSLDSLFSKEEIRLSKHCIIEAADSIQLNFTVLLLKKIFLDLEFFYIKIYQRLGFKNEQIDEYYEKSLKKAFEDLYKKENYNFNSYMPFFCVNLDKNLFEFIQKGFLNEIYLCYLAEFLSKCLNEKIMFSFTLKDKDLLELNYCLTQAPSNDNLVYLDLLKEIIKILISFLENNQFSNANKLNLDTNFSHSSYEMINSLYSKISKRTIFTTKSSIINNNSIKNENNTEIISESLNSFEIDFDLIFKKINKFNSANLANEKNQIALNYKMFESLENFLPKSFLNNLSPTYQLTVEYDLSLLPNIDSKRIENDKITYDALFLKINKEKDILFDYDIETVIYKFLEHDVIQSLRKNGQFDYLYYSRLSNDMKKFYADFDAFIKYDDNLKFKNCLEEQIFEKILFDFAYENGKVTYKINRNLAPNRSMSDYLDNFEKENNLLEKKNDLLNLFNETKAAFLIKEEFGLFNFVDAMLSSNAKNSLITGIDINSIIIKIFNEFYVNHNLIFEDNKTVNQPLVEEFKKIFVEKFLTKSYLDLNYLFNNPTTFENFKLNENDFHKIININFNNNLFKSKIVNANNNHTDKLDNCPIKTITRNISNFVEKKMLAENQIQNLDDLMKKLSENYCINNFFLAKHSKLLSNSNEFKTLKINDLKEITFDIEKESSNKFQKKKLFIMKYDENKKNIVINYLKQITDFYVSFDII